MIGTYLAVGLLIIVIFFTAKFWLWIYKNAFGIQINKKILIITFLIGAIAAFSILLFPKIASYLSFVSFTDNEYNWQVVLYFLLYLNTIIVAVSLILKSFSIKQFLNLLLFNLYFVILFAIFKNLDLDVFVLSIVLYYLFVAYGEEFIKNQLAFVINNKIGQLDSDLLLYHILVAIGFAFWENIVYLIGGIGFTTFLATIAGGISIVIMRGLLGFGAHTFYSSLVGMGNLLGFFSIICFILISMLVHYGYDLALYFDYKIVIPIFIIVVYAWISYVFYKVDRLYIDF